jgi:hypothetical protein
MTERNPATNAAFDGLAQAQCVATYRRWLYLPDPGALYVALGTVAANLSPGDPIWLALVGPPGSGKTETINPLASLDFVYPAATLTEPALLSGVPHKQRASNAKGGLLRQIGEFGILLCKDFTSVLAQNRDARSAVLAALREIYDGSWTRHVGSDGGVTLHWSGKLGIVSGCTPSIDVHHAVMAAMGERLMLYRLPGSDPDTVAKNALRHIGKERAMRAELTEAVRALLDSIDRGRKPAALTDSERQRVADLADFAVRCRSAVERDGYDHEVLFQPEPEGPGRFATDGPLPAPRPCHDRRARGRMLAGTGEAGLRLHARQSLDASAISGRANRPDYHADHRRRLGHADQNRRSPP